MCVYRIILNEIADAKNTKFAHRKTYYISIDWHNRTLRTSRSSSFYRRGRRIPNWVYRRNVNPRISIFILYTTLSEAATRISAPRNITISLWQLILCTFQFIRVAALHPQIVRYLWPIECERVQSGSSLGRARNPRTEPELLRGQHNMYKGVVCAALKVLAHTYAYSANVNTIFNVV